MKRNKLAGGFFAICVLFATTSGTAHAAALTVLSVKSALTEVIQSMRDALAEATSDLQSIGNSMQANAQNVLADVDRILGKKLEYTFNRLDATELRLVEDTQALTNQMRLATQQIIAKAGDEARKTIVEADIAAYNTSYSLPCRDARPRIVASFPARLIAGRDSPKITLRGNFLRQGGEPVVTINGVTARLVERLDSALSVEIPAAVLQSAVDDEVLVSAKVSNLQTISRSLWAWGLLGCHESTEAVVASPIALTALQPPYRYVVTGTVAIERTDYREVAEAAQAFANTGSNQCDDNYRVDTQWCLTGPGTMVRADVQNVSANCNSGFEGTTPSGERCVLARGKVAGCGANRGPFNTWLGCKGRGWLNYSITLIRKEPYQAITTPKAVAKQGRPGELSFTFEMPSAVGFENPLPRYTLQVEKRQGRKLAESYSVSHANPNAGPVTSRANASALAVEVLP